MKTSHKQHIRCLMMERLYDEEIRYRMDSFLDSVEQRTGDIIDTFEAMEFYEQEVERINKMFRYPQQGTEVTGTNYHKEVAS